MQFSIMNHPDFSEAYARFVQSFNTISTILEGHEEGMAALLTLDDAERDLRKIASDTGVKEGFYAGVVAAVKAQSRMQGAAQQAPAS